MGKTIIPATSTSSIPSIPKEPLRGKSTEERPIQNKNETQKNRAKSSDGKEKKEKYVMPDYLKKAKVSTLLNKSSMYSTKGLEIEKPKEAPKDAGHQGATAAFAVKETFDAINAIRAKLESAERR